MNPFVLQLGHKHNNGTKELMKYPTFSREGYQEYFQNKHGWQSFKAAQEFCCGAGHCQCQGQAASLLGAVPKVLEMADGDSVPRFCVLGVVLLRYAMDLIDCFCQMMFISGTKYVSEQTSVGSKRNETDKFTYPSITFCHTFKNRAHITKHILKDCKKLSSLPYVFSKVKTIEFSNDVPL